MDANSRANLSKTDRIGHLLKLIEEDLDSVNFQMRRTRMKEHISQLRAILFPIENLPDELLLEIFTHYRDLNPVSIPYKARVAGEVVATMNSVLNISWVCTRWRQLAIRCSPLWSDFGVALEGKTIGEWEGNIDFHKELVDLFLARSGKHPLSLRLSVETFGITLPEHPTLVMLSRHSTRWRAVRFLELDFNNVFPTLATLELPVLKLLEMLGDDFNLVNCVLANAPLVDTFKVRSPVLPQAEKLFAWKSIRHLSFCMGRPFSLRNLHYILAACGDLKQLSLTRDWGDHDFQGALRIPIYLLPSLESLSISMEANQPLPTEVAFSISSLRAPILKELSLFYTQYTEFKHSRFPDIESFLSRSTCSSSLTRLSLSGLSLSDKEAVRLLERLTLLEELSIRDSWPYQTTESPITNRFIKSLHAYRKSELRPSAKKPLIRNLHTLKLSPYATRNGKEVPFNPKAFVDTVLSRWIDPAAPYIALPNMSVVNLRLVELDFQIGPGDEEESETDSNTEVLEVPEPFWVYRLLLPLQKAGLNITIKKQQKTKRRVVKNVLQMVASEEFDSEEEDEDEDEGSI